jgi:hypothetical protein
MHSLTCGFTELQTEPNSGIPINRELTQHLAIAAAEIMRLTLENTKLLTDLEAARGVTRLDTAPSSRRPFN